MTLHDYDYFRLMHAGIPIELSMVIMLDTKILDLFNGKHQQLHIYTCHARKTKLNVTIEQFKEIYCGHAVHSKKKYISEAT